MRRFGEGIRSKPLNSTDAALIKATQPLRCA